MGCDLYLMATQDRSQFFVFMTQSAQDIRSDPMLRILQKQQPVTPVYCEHCNDISEALEREKQLKAMSPAEKTALVDSVNPDWTDVTDH